MNLPGALAGMLGVSALLLLIGAPKADALVHFYDKYTSWTAGLLPLFYAPALATIPVLLEGRWALAWILTMQPLNGCA